MAKERGGKFRALYGIVFSLYTLFVGGLLVLQTWSIYRSAERSPYTVESISAHFAEISLFVWIWLGGLVLSVLLALIFPQREKRAKATVDEKLSLSRIKKRLPDDQEYQAEIAKIGKKARAERAVTVTLCVLAAVAAAALCLAILADKWYIPVIERDFFKKNDGLADRLVQTATLAVAALLLAWLGTCAVARSRKREQKRYVALIARAKQPKPVPVESVPAEKVEEPLSPATAEEQTPKALADTLAVIAEEGFFEDALQELPEELSPPDEPTPPTPPVQKTAQERWGKVVRKIVGMLFLGEPHTQAEIDEQIKQVLLEKERERTENAPAQQTQPAQIATPAQKPKEKSKKALRAEKKLQEQKARLQKKVEEYKKATPAAQPAEKPAAQAEGKTADTLTQKRAKKPAKKEKPAKTAPKAKKVKKVKKPTSKGVWAVRIALGAAGIALVLLGVYNGGMQDTLKKAINICTQCIGLG